MIRLAEDHSLEDLKARLAKLKRLDQISVTWIDASQCSNVSIAGRVADHVVETRIISDGRFLGIQNGNTFDDPHMLILKDCNDYDRGSVQSIPLVLVKEIQAFEKIPLLFKKTNPSGSSATFRVRYPDGVVKVVRITDKTRVNENGF